MRCPVCRSLDVTIERDKRYPIIVRRRRLVTCYRRPVGCCVLRIATCSNTYYHTIVETISVKLPNALRRKLAAEAGRRNVAQSVIVRESIERALARSSSSKEPASCAELAGDLIGAIRSGRKDSGTAKALLEEAMMQGGSNAPKRRR